MPKPLVSVIIPTFNREAVITRAVDSILNQSYQNLEVIIVDDGSTDGTVDALKNYGDRIQVIVQENAGPSAARNRGVKASSGEIIAFLDSDDAWKANKLEQQVSLLNEGGPEVICCVTNATIFEKSGETKNAFSLASVDSTLSKGFWLNPSLILATRFLQFNTVVAIRRSFFEECGGFKEEMRILEDHDLAFRLALKGPWAFISEPLVDKFHETHGIGVAVMENQLEHTRFWQTALQGLIQDKDLTCSQTRHWLSVGLKDATTEIRILEKRPLPGPLGDLLQKLQLKASSYQKAIRRRSPSWPQVEAVSTLG